MRIGLLEDDSSQIELISLWANEAGDQLQSYTTGKSFREAMSSENFDLLVLDWHLPDTTGIEELDWLRGVKASNTPVIFITSRDSEESVVEALDHGADDYMVKPVVKEVTLARIKAIQRRNRLASAAGAEVENTPSQPSGIEVFEPYEINNDEHSITVNGEAVKLTHKEFELAVLPVSQRRLPDLTRSPDGTHLGHAR